MGEYGGEFPHRVQRQTQKQDPLRDKATEKQSESFTIYKQLLIQFILVIAVMPFVDPLWITLTLSKIGLKSFFLIRI